MTRQLRLLMILAAAAGALAPAAHAWLPQTAPVSRLVAAGAGGTTIACSTAEHARRYTGSTYYVLSGSTTCDTPVQQSCELTYAAQSSADSVDLTGSLFGTTCSLGTEANGDFTGQLEYRTIVQSPPGELWVGAPTSCSGVGTTRLDCTFAMPATPV